MFREPVFSARGGWLLGLVFAGTAMTGTPATADKALVFRDVQVFDGQTMLPPTSVLVREGRIQTVERDLEPPQDADVVDGRGKTLLPGFIDSHTHTQYADQLVQAAVFGVTTELDMFSDHRFAAQMRAQQQAGEANGRADLLSAGTLATAAGGHGTQFGLPIPTLSRPEQAQPFVDARVAEGSDYIKIVYDDGKSYGMQFSTVDRATVAALIQAARARNKMAVAHISTRQAAREVIEDGIDGLVHMFVNPADDDALVELAAQKKIFIVPTLSVLAGVTGQPSGKKIVEDAQLAPYLSPDAASSLKSSFPRQSGEAINFPGMQEAIRKLKTAGVAILAGSDAPNPATAHGASIHGEMDLLVDCGLTPVEALTAATSAPAARFGLNDRGRIAPGLRADLVLVEGDPAKDIRTTRAIVGVWKAGHRVDRESYRKRVAEESERMAKAKSAAPPPGSESGLVSDFEANGITSAFGTGWSVSTDMLAGGKSEARHEWAKGGARDSQGSLHVTGKVEDRPQPRWAGVNFSPGMLPFAPANLSNKSTISFWAKGDGKTYNVMLFAQRFGFRPAMKSFTAGKEWKQHKFAIRDFDNSDGSDILAIFLGASSEAGEFSLYIDDVRFDK